MRTFVARSGLLAFMAVSALGCAKPEEDLRSQLELSVRRPNILIYVIDTLRQDRLGCYGYDRPTSPEIDAFASQSTLFENAIGQSSWTRPSMASIFTGVWPPSHGTTGWKHQLPDRFETLTEILARAGYDTAAFVGNPQISVRYGFGQGFARFTRKIKKPSGDYNRMALEWLEGRSRTEPWFLYIHTMDPHAPYRPPQPFLEQFASSDSEMPTWQPRWRWPIEALPYLSDRYDGEIAHNDASFGELLGEIEQRDLLEDALIVLTSDHGEEFREHGKWRHGENLHAETLNVPLIVKFPKQRDGRRVETVVQHIDIMPTILDYLALEIPAAVEGNSMLTVAQRPASVYSHLFLSGPPLYYSLVEGQWKLIRRIDEDGTTTQLLYDREEDPRELIDLAMVEPERVARFAARLDAKLATVDELQEAAELPLTEEMQKELEALGYLE